MLQKIKNILSTTYYLEFERSKKPNSVVHGKSFRLICIGSGESLPVAVGKHLEDLQQKFIDENIYLSKIKRI